MFRELSICVITLVITLLSQSVKSQTMWLENFKDSNHSQSPQWIGDTAHFEVNPQLELQLNAPAISSRKFLSTKSNMAWNGMWEWRFKYAFNPSTSNYARFYLMANHSHPDSTEGYAVFLGGNSEDRIQFLYVQNGVSQLLMESDKDLLDHSSIDLSMKIERTIGGYFKCFVDTGAGMFLMDSVYHTQCLKSSFVIWDCHFTSTRSDRFYLDDIVVNGLPYIDDKPIELIDVEIYSTNELKLKFDENIAVSSVNMSQSFHLNGTSTPVHFSVKPDALQELILRFETSFDDGQNQMSIRGLTDTSGNKMKDTTVVFMFQNPSSNEVHITEVMFDPDPAVQLPECDYIEVYNNGNKALNTEGWKLCIDDDTVNFLKSTLPPDSFLLLCASSCSGSFSNLNTTFLDLPSNFLTLSGGTISIYDQWGELLANQNYEASMYQHSEKRKGGWSIEKDLSWLACEDKRLWAASESLKGGSPGALNTVSYIRTKNIITPYKHCVYVSRRAIEIHFFEEVDSLGFGSTLKIDSSVRVTPFSHRIWFEEEMKKDERHYLYWENWINCFGENRTGDTAWFGLPESDHELWISEVLFDPKDPASDFVEIYTGASFSVLSDLRLAQIGADGEPSEVEFITRDSILLAPNRYYAFTEDREGFTSECKGKSAYLLEVPHLPSMPADRGSIGVCNAQLSWIDRTIYDDSWHHEMISQTKGVSLERLSFQHTTNKENWHSASFSCGFSTPGQRNSQFLVGSASAGIQIEPDLFTPDNDGYNDFVKVSINLSDPGWVATVTVFDAFGREVNTIVDNRPIEQVNEFVWKGINEWGMLEKRGSYIIFVQLWNPDGRSQVFKKACRLHYD